MQHSRKLVLAGAAAAIGAVLAAAVIWMSWPEPSSHTTGPPAAPVSAPKSPDPQPQDPAPDWVAEAIDQLAGKHWDRAAAAEVVGFHREWLGALRANDPKGFDLTVTRLGQLRDPDRLAGVLTRRPELAGLLAMADDPVALARVLDGGGDGELLTSLFAAHLHRDDARRLAAALPADAGLIARLARRGLPGAEALLVDAATPGDDRAADDAYRAWVRDTLGRALDRADDEALADAVLFLAAEGPGVRRRLAEPRFRETFRRRWDDLRRLAAGYREQAVAEHHRAGNPDPDPAALPGLADLAALPGVWEFLDEPHAGRLFARLGPLAVEILHGPGSDPALRPRAAELLLAGDDCVVRLLATAGRDPVFRSFLEKNVPAGLLSEVAADLDARPDADRGKRLLFLQGRLNESRDALRDAVGRKEPGVVGYLPGYDVYRVLRAYSDGDDVTDDDLLLAGADLVLTLAPAARAGVKLTKEAAKGTIRHAAEKAATARLGAEAVKKAGGAAVNHASAWLVACRAYRKAVEVVRSVLLDRPKQVVIHLPVPRVDITGAVRLAFTRAGVGRETFKRLSGLEARLFMRADARVVLRFHYVIEGAAVRGWLRGHLIAACGYWFEETATIPPEAAKRLPPPEEWDDPDAWKRSLGTLFLASLADLLPAAGPG